MAQNGCFSPYTSEGRYSPRCSLKIIIREGVGTHFDPNVAKAFLDAEEEVRRVAATKTHQNIPIDG